MRRFAVLTRMFLLMNLRDRETLFWCFAFPIGLLLLLGAANLGAGAAPWEAAAWLMAGVLVMNVMTAGLGVDSTWLATMRDRGVLLRLRVAPLPVTDLVAAYTAVRLGLVMLQSILIVAAAVLVFGVRLGWQAIIPALLVTLAGGAVFLLLGQAVAAASPTASAASVLSNMIYFPVLFLSNLVIGIAAFPDWLERMVQWLPAALLVDLLRPILTAEPALHTGWANLAGLLGYGLLALVIVARWFRWESRT